MKKRVSILKKEDGFTILEVVISIVFLGVIVVTFFSAFIMMINIRQFNESRQASTNFAKTRMEDIKYLAISGRFDDIGTKNGSVKGILEDTEKNVKIGGRNFDIITNIWWEDEEVDGTVTPNAYKRIEVIVQERRNYTFPTPAITMSTLIAREEEPPNINNGTIVVETQRRYNRQPGVMIEMFNPLIRQVTDSEGKLILTDLSPGDYKITVDHEENGIMVEPTSIKGSFPDIKWVFNNEKEINKLSKGAREVVTFEVDWPSFIKLNLLDGEGKPIDLSQYKAGLSLDIEISEESFDIANNYVIKDMADLGVLSSVELWPRYAYNIVLEDKKNNIAYNMQDVGNEEWDGTFPDSDEPQKKDISLTVAGVVKAGQPSGLLPIGTKINLSTLPENMNIYYTIDNTSPDLDSIVYNPFFPPVVPLGELRIRAIAYKDGYLIGPESIFVYQGELLP